MQFSTSFIIEKELKRLVFTPFTYKQTEGYGNTVYWNRNKEEMLFSVNRMTFAAAVSFIKEDQELDAGGSSFLQHIRITMLPKRC